MELISESESALDVDGLVHKFPSYTKGGSQDS
jgi:hypothetical protein